MPKLYLGTSGWNYGDWKGRFYPEQMPSRQWLSYYSKKFSTVELNYSFYHLPRPATYRNWAAAVPDDFIFSLKASRFITHIKKLKGAKTALNKFLDNAQVLEHRLGPILFQLPPSFKAAPSLLEQFLGAKNKQQRWVFEFRHGSWFSPEIFEILRQYNVALVIADSSRYPLCQEITADFTYLRFHGSQAMFSSKYTEKELKTRAKEIKKWASSGDVYIYFNNDIQAAAPENAEMIRKMLKS